jgi:hypothetical protein
MVGTPLVRRTGPSLRRLETEYPIAVTNETRMPGDLLVRIGAIVFAVGAAATLATMTPLFLGAHPLPTPAYFVSMLMGVGLALALGGLLRAARAQRRQARAAAAARSAA